MGMFDEFLGKSDGYTGAQRTGLQRSAEIKKRRKEDERAFEKTQKREEGARTLIERGMTEAGATRRTRMGEAGAVERERMSNVGMLARQRLVGEQDVEAASAKSVREADAASMKYARGLTIEGLRSETDVRVAEIRAKDPLAELLGDEDTGEAVDVRGKKIKKRPAWSEFDY